MSKAIPLLVSPLRIEAHAFQVLLGRLGPSLGLWRAAEVAVLRRHPYARPIVDVGCGDGLVASMVLSRIEIGCDPFLESLKRAATTGVYESLKAVPIEEAGIVPASIATVVCNSVMEHLENPDPVIAAVSRMLRPGGHFVFTTPTDRFADWLMLPVSSYRSWRNRHLVHVNLWSKERWAGVLRRHGLVVESVRPYLKPALVLAWDFFDLLEQVWVARRRLLGLVWQRLPRSALTRLGRAASRLDLSAKIGGGQMIVGVKQP